jgi:hypothetical protein
MLDFPLQEPHRLSHPRISLRISWDRLFQVQINGGAMSGATSLGDSLTSFAHDFS